MRTVGLLGLKDKKAVEAGVPDFAPLCIAHANLIYTPEALSEWDRKAMFICWQFSGTELHCMLPLEITKYFTSLISLIFTGRDAAVKGGSASLAGGQDNLGGLSRGRGLFAEI